MEVLDFLLSEDIIVKYMSMADFLNYDIASEDMKNIKKEILKDNRVQDLIDKASALYTTVLKNHNKADHPTHILSFLTEIGIGVDDSPLIKKLAQEILDSYGPENTFQVTANIPIHFGGTGEDMNSWMMCDTPLLSYSLAKLGFKNNDKVKSTIEKLLSLSNTNGYRCTASAALGKFRGPGRKDDPCPYANLLIAKLFSIFPEYHNEQRVLNSINMLLDQWENKANKRFFLFGMKNKFTKLKMPFVWYDILHLSYVLSFYKSVSNDKRFLDMLNVIKSKADSNGLYTAESVYLKWKGWDFRDKKKPSSFITYYVYKTLKNAGQIQSL